MSRASSTGLAAGATERDHRIAAELAEGAGRVLLELRERLVAEGLEPKAIKDAGDQGSQAWLADEMARLLPGEAVLSEEARDDLSRLDAERVWIIDPLDGTREFSEYPRSDWAVHVALTLGGVPIAGAVALPALGEVLHTAAPAVVPAHEGAPRVVVSRSRPPASALAVAEALDGVLVEMGSAGAKAMAVVRGEVDVYVHSGGQYEWDSCAPVAVAQAAGLHVSRLDGSPMLYNNENPYLPDLCICRVELAEAVLAAVRNAAS